MSIYIIIFIWASSLFGFKHREEYIISMWFQVIDKDSLFIEYVIKPYSTDQKYIRILFCKISIERHPMFIKEFEKSFQAFTLERIQF